MLDMGKEPTPLESGEWEEMKSTHISSPTPFLDQSPRPFIDLPPFHIS